MRGIQDSPAPQSELSFIIGLANMSRWPYGGLLLGQRRRRWANSNSTLGQRLMFLDMLIYGPMALPCGTNESKKVDL